MSEDRQRTLQGVRHAGRRLNGNLAHSRPQDTSCHALLNMCACAVCRYPLQLGWFIVKNPNQAALLRGTSSVSARQQEDMFFDSAAPWNRMPSEQKARLGKTSSPGSIFVFAPSFC